MSWKLIPGFEKYAISNTGIIKNMNKGTIRKLCPTADGYLMMTVKKDGRCYALYPHKLVCTLFNGVKPSDKHVVNHKDGIKANNHHSNLEWVTQSGNVKHAFMMGLSPIAAQIQITDTVNGNVFVAKSINEVIGLFGVSKYVMTNHLKAGNDELFQGRYLFEMVREPQRVDGRLGVISIYDYKKQVQDFVNSIPMASIRTGVESYLIKKALKNGGLVNGVGFRYMDGNAYLTCYTDADIAASISEYARDRTYRVKNYLTEEIIAYNQVVDIAEYFGVAPDMIYSHLRRDTNELFRAHYIVQGDDEFPDQSVDRIVVSQLWGSMPTRPVKAISKSTGDESYHKSIFALGKELAISNSQMDRYAKANRVPGYDLVFI